MDRQFRRGFLGAVAGAGSAVLAGCSGLLDDGAKDDGGGIGEGNGEGNAATQWARWVPAEFVGAETGGLVSRVDIDRFREEIPRENRSDLDFRETEARFGLSEGALEEMIAIEQSSGESHSIILGEFDREPIVQTLGGESTTASGYRVVQDRVAVDDGVIINSADFRAIDAAQAGDARQLAERGDDWRSAVEHVGSGAFGAIDPVTEYPWEMQAVQFSGSGDGRVQMIAYAYFESAAAAEANETAVREEVASDTDANVDYEIQRVTVDGNVVVVNGTSTDRSV